MTVHFYPLACFGVEYHFGGPSGEWFCGGGEVCFDERGCDVWMVVFLHVFFELGYGSCGPGASHGGSSHEEEVGFDGFVLECSA